MEHKPLNGGHNLKLAGTLIIGIFFASIVGAAPNSDNTRLHFELTHSGGTDKCGCHHKTSTGEYHCHTRKKRGGDCPA